MYRKKIIFDKKEKQGTFYAYLRGILILFGSMYIDIILQAVIISHWKPLNPGGLLAINNKPAGTIPWRKPLSQPSWQPEAEVVKALLVSAAEVATGKVHSEPQVPHSAAGCTREHSRRKSGTWLCNRVFSFVWLHCQHHTYWNTLAAS